MAEGQRQSRRPDGTLRPAVRVREGYIPPEEQSKYSDKWKSEDDGAGGIPGAGTDPATEAKPMSKTAAKNKRRIERDRTLKPEKDGAGKTEGGDSLASADAPLGGSDAGSLSSSTVGSRPPAAAGAAPAASEGVNEVGEVEKKIKTLRKRLRQIEELEEKLMSGALLNADQTAKVASKERIEAEVAKWEALGEVDVGKRIKNLKKKIRQIEELEDRAKAGGDINQDQQEKIDHKHETVSELALLEGMLNVKL